VLEQASNVLIHAGFCARQNKDLFFSFEVILKKLESSFL
jgi:hypothetical protein